MSIESPGLHRIESTTVVAECCAKDVPRHRLVGSCQSNDVGEFSTSTSLLNGNLLIDARAVKEMTGGGGAAQLLGVWSLLWDDLMTGTPPSRAI